MELVLAAALVAALAGGIAGRWHQRHELRTTTRDALDDGDRRRIAARQAWLAATLPTPSQRVLRPLPVGAGRDGHRAAQQLLTDREAA